MLLAVPLEEARELDVMTSKQAYALLVNTLNTRHRINIFALNFFYEDH
jgi:hypothetical protein